jgi:hypothetical protein
LFEKMMGLSSRCGSVINIGMRIALIAAEKGFSDSCAAISLSPASRASPTAHV